MVLRLSAAAALWLRFMGVPCPAAQEPPGCAPIVFYAGPAGALAALVLTQPASSASSASPATCTLASAAAAGAKLPGIAVNAALMATTQVGGVANLHGAASASTLACSW